MPDDRELTIRVNVVAGGGNVLPGGSPQHGGTGSRPGVHESPSSGGIYDPQRTLPGMGPPGQRYLPGMDPGAHARNEAERVARDMSVLSQRVTEIARRIHDSLTPLVGDLRTVVQAVSVGGISPAQGRVLTRNLAQEDRTGRAARNTRMGRAGFFFQGEEPESSVRATSLEAAYAEVQLLKGRAARGETLTDAELARLTNLESSGVVERGFAGRVRASQARTQRTSEQHRRGRVATETVQGKAQAIRDETQAANAHTQSLSPSYAEGQELISRAARGEGITDAELARLSNLEALGAAPRGIASRIRASQSRARSAHGTRLRKEDASLLRAARDSGDPDRVHETRLDVLESQRARGEKTEPQVERESSALWEKRGKRLANEQEKAARERNALDDKNARIQDRIASSQATIHRQMSYVGMAAMEAGRGFGYLGAMAGKSSAQILQVIAGAEALFSLGRSIPLAASAFERIAAQRVKIQRDRAQLTGLTGGAGGAEGGSLFRAEGLAGTVAGGVVTGLEPAAVGAGWVGGAAAGGALSRFLAGPAFGPTIAAGAGLAAAGIGYLGTSALSASAPLWNSGMYPETWHPTSPMMTGMTRMYQGPQLQRLWGGIASSYAGAGRQAAATAPIYEASQAKWERGLELGRYGAGAAVREQFLGRIPGMTMPERPLVEAQSEEAQAAARLGVSRGARVSAQAAQDKMEADQRKDNANNGRLLQRQRELEGKTYQVLNTNGTSGTNYENLSKAEMQELKDLRSGKGYTGASTNEVEEKKNQVIKSYTQEIEDLRASHASTQKRIAAEKTVAESYMQIAQQQFGEARTEARKAADAIMERRKGIGQLQEGEFAQLQIATNMALAGADPRVMPPGFRDMVRSGLGGRRAQQSLLSRERALGSQRIDMMGAENVEGGDEGQLKFWNRILGVAAGTTPSAEGQPGLPNIREQRMKLSEADFQMLKDSVLYDKEMVKLLTSMDRAMKQIADFGVQIKEGERAANKNAGNVPAGGIGPGQKQAVGGQ